MWDWQAIVSMVGVKSQGWAWPARRRKLPAQITCASWRFLLLLEEQLPKRTQGLLTLLDTYGGPWLRGGHGNETGCCSMMGPGGSPFHKLLIWAAGWDIPWPYKKNAGHKRGRVLWSSGASCLSKEKQHEGLLVVQEVVSSKEACSYFWPPLVCLWHGPRFCPVVPDTEMGDLGRSTVGTKQANQKFRRQSLEHLTCPFEI